MKHKYTISIQFRSNTEVLPDCYVRSAVMKKLGMSHFKKSTAILEVYIAHYGSNL